MANQPSNHFKYMLYTKKIDFLTDTFKIILMASGFVFNRDTHATYADVSSAELASGNGYTQNAKVLQNVGVTEDDTLDMAIAAWDSAVWTASGGPIGPTPGAIIIDDTTTDDTVCAYIDFGAEQTANNGGDMEARTPKIRLG